MIPISPKGPLTIPTLTPPHAPPFQKKNVYPQIIEEDRDVPDNYIAHTLRNTKPFPPVTLRNFWMELNWPHVIALLFTPVLALYGVFTTKLTRQTALFSIFYYFFTGLGITAGYHRLWSHRSYNASKPLEYMLALAGVGAVQGSIKWWARDHRAHHRYTDTDLDPYGAHHGVLWSHLGWMLVKPRLKSGVADVSDLRKNEVVRWQHRNYLSLLLTMALVVPTLIAGLAWGDWRGGLFYAGFARLVFVHHSTFAVNSLAHYVGSTPFDDKHTPRDHLLTALVTIGEGYHNFHHQFPMDYRNAIRWYQYDPTKWFIVACQFLGLATHLRSFPENEVRKGQLTMELKRLRRTQDALTWPQDLNELPVISWASFQEQSLKRPLLLISGFIHDVSSFMDEHPGGRHFLAKNVGKDATTAFFGGVYDHSNAAHNLLAMMRVGVLHGGLELEVERIIPPSQRLRVMRANEISSSCASSTAFSESESDEPLKSVA